MGEPGVQPGAVVKPRAVRTASGTGRETQKQIGQRVSRGRSCGLRAEGERPAAVAHDRSIRLETMEVEAEFERMLPMDKRQAIGKLKRPIDAPLWEVGWLAEGRETLHAGLRNAGVRRSVETRTLNPELLDELDVLVVRHARVLELRHPGP